MSCPVTAAIAAAASASRDEDDEKKRGESVLLFFAVGTDDRTTSRGAEEEEFLAAAEKYWEGTAREAGERGAVAGTAACDPSEHEETSAATCSSAVGGADVFGRMTTARRSILETKTHRKEEARAITVQ